MRWVRVGGAGGATLAGAAALGLLAARWRVRLARLPADHAAYWRRRARRPGRLYYVALGDSLAQGLSATKPWRGYVGQLADWLAERAGCEVAVRNLSVSGATVADALAGQLPELARLCRERPVHLITVCLGGNDLARTGPHEFRSAFSALCAELLRCRELALGGEPGRGGEPPVVPVPVLVADVPQVRFGPHRELARRYAEICREVLAEFPGLCGVRLYRATSDLRPRELGMDLMHPGVLGHRRYAAAFRAALQDEPGIARVGPSGAAAAGEPTDDSGGASR